MPRLFITKWVLARGILVTQGKLEGPPTPQGRLQRAWICLPGMRYAQPLLLGRELFLTFEDAQEDAKKRFEAALQQGERWAAYLKKAVTNLDQLQVHEGIQRVNLCHAFSDAQELILEPSDS